jgi:hypothetical protein
VNSAISILFLNGIFGETWQGFLYPSRSDLTRHVDLGAFASLEECRASAMQIIGAAGWPDATWECGLNCEPPSTDGGLWVCETTSE